MRGPLTGGPKHPYERGVPVLLRAVADTWPALRAIEYFVASFVTCY